MRNILVAVWGSPGAGTTTFCAALAAKLAKSLTFILLCNANPYVPAYAQWGVLAGTGFADDQMHFAEPIRKALDYPNISVPYIKKRLAGHPTIKQIGVFGGFINERLEQFNPISGNAANAFLDCVKEFAQVTIVDCMQPQLDFLSLRSLEKADLRITILEPNVLGVAFQYAQEHILNTLPNLSGRKVFVAGKVGKMTPVEKFEYERSVSFHCRLPYDEEARNRIERIGGKDLFSAYGGAYGKTINLMAETVKEVMADGGHAAYAV